jgi:hypothetical protein
MEGARLGRCNALIDHLRCAIHGSGSITSLPSHTQNPGQIRLSSGVNIRHREDLAPKNQDPDIHRRGDPSETAACWRHQRSGVSSSARSAIK